MRPLLRCLSAVACICLGCLATYRLEATDTFSRPDSTFAGLSLNTRNGPIKVTASAGQIATVTVCRFAYGRDSSAAAAALSLITVDDTLLDSVWQVTADVPLGSRTSGAAIEALVRAKMPVSIATVNDEITVSGLTAGINIAAANSSVTTTGTAGELSISTTNQCVTVQIHSGRTKIATTGATVECDLALLEPASQNRISTTDAKITLLLPADVSATVVANTTNGDILISGFQVTYEEHAPGRVKARIGSGAATVTISTSNGDIIIRPRS